jgi:hypothetical protein
MNPIELYISALEGAIFAHLLALPCMFFLLNHPFTTIIHQLIKYPESFVSLVSFVVIFSLSDLPTAIHLDGIWMLFP